MANRRVRYIRIPVTSLEIVCTQADADIARFIRIIFDSFQKLEAGEALQNTTDSNPLTRIALTDALPELEEGYRTYKKRQTGQRTDIAKGQPEDDQRATSGQPPVAVEIEESNKEKEIEKDISHIKYPAIKQDVQHRKNLTPEQIDYIWNELNKRGIEPDAGFWNTADKKGFDAVEYALACTGAVGNNSLKGITKIIAHWEEEQP